MQADERQDAVSERAQTGDSWPDIHSAVKFLSELVEQSLAAFGSESVDKVISATTRKRLAFRALQGLRESKGMLQGLSANLNELQRASQQWERNIVYASKSHKDLMEQLESTSSELHATLDRLRRAEAERLGATREVDGLRQQLLQAQADKQALKATLKQKEAQIDEVTFGTNEANSAVSAMAEEAAHARQSAQEAYERAEAAAAALDAARDEAAKERAARERHEDAVARLVSDNLVFLTRAEEAQQKLAACEQERSELRAALDHQKGPWFDAVRAGVEARVKEALTRAEALQTELMTARTTHQHTLDQLSAEKADLETFLGDARTQIAQLESDVEAARRAAAEACEEAGRAGLGEARCRREVEEKAAELRVAAESLRGMREECNERWLSQQTALKDKAAMEASLSEVTTEAAELRQQVQSSRDDLATQRAVNQQLMLKKEEVEWQLMAALAKLNSGHSCSGADAQNCTGGSNEGGSSGQLRLPYGSAEALLHSAVMGSSPPHQFMTLPPSHEGSLVLHGVSGGSNSPQANASLPLLGQERSDARRGDGIRHNQISQDQFAGSAFAATMQQQQQQQQQQQSHGAPATTSSSSGSSSQSSTPTHAAHLPRFTSHTSNSASAFAQDPDLFNLPSLSLGIASLPPIMAPSGSSYGDPLSHLGTTGGLMAQFSPLHGTPRGSIRGEVFPPSATATALTEEEEAGLRSCRSGSFRLPVSLAPPAVLAAPGATVAAGGTHLVADPVGVLPGPAFASSAGVQLPPRVPLAAGSQEHGNSWSQLEQQDQLSQQQQRLPQPGTLEQHHRQQQQQANAAQPSSHSPSHPGHPMHPAMHSGQPAAPSPRPHPPTPSVHNPSAVTTAVPLPHGHHRRHTADTMSFDTGASHSRDSSPTGGWHTRLSDGGGGTHSARMAPHSILSHGGSRPGTPNLVKRVSFSDLGDAQGTTATDAHTGGVVAAGSGVGSGVSAPQLSNLGRSHAEAHVQGEGGASTSTAFSMASHRPRGSSSHHTSSSVHKAHAPREPWTPPKVKAVHPIFGSMVMGSPGPNAGNGTRDGAAVPARLSSEVVITAAPS